MKRFGFILLLFISIVSFAQSNKTSSKKNIKTTKTKTLPANTEVWTVDAMRAKCEGTVTANCLLVKK